MSTNMPTILTCHPSLQDQNCKLSANVQFEHVFAPMTGLQLLLDKHKFMVLHQAWLYSSSVSTESLFRQIGLRQGLNPDLWDPKPACYPLSHFSSLTHSICYMCRPQTMHFIDWPSKTFPHTLPKSLIFFIT